MHWVPYQVSPSYHCESAECPLVPWLTIVMHADRMRPISKSCSAYARNPAASNGNWPVSRDVHEQGIPENQIYGTQTVDCIPSFAANNPLT